MAGLLGMGGGGLLGGGKPGGLLGGMDPQKQYMIRQMLMGAGMGLLNRDPYAPPTGFMGAVGRAGSGAVQAAQQAPDEYLERQRYQMEMDRWKQEEADKQRQRHYQDRAIMGMPKGMADAAQAYPGIAESYLTSQYAPKEPIKGDSDTVFYDPVTRERMGGGGNGQSNMFSGKSLDAQALNYLVRTGQLDQTTAANIGAGKQFTGPDGSIIFATPADIQRALMQANGQGAGARLTGGKKTESEVKGDAILSGIESSIATAVKGFDELASARNTALGAVPYGMGRVGQTGDAQATQDAMSNIVQNYIYALSGQQAPEAEVQRQVKLLLPSPVDKKEAIDGKRARLMDMINTIKSRAQGPGGNGVDQNAPASGGRIRIDMDGNILQ